MVKPSSRFSSFYRRNLLKFAASETHVFDGLVIPFHLSEVKTYTFLSFRVNTDFGPTGMETIERLQSFAVALPGPPDKVLFDKATAVTKTFSLSHLRRFGK